MMTITNADVCDLNAAFNRLHKIQLTAKLRWDMARNARLVRGAFSDVEEVRTQLVKQHDKNNDDSISLGDPEWNTFIHALQVVMNTKVELALRPMVFTDAILEEVDKALDFPPTEVAAKADKDAKAAAKAIDESNAALAISMKGAFSLLVAFNAGSLMDA